MYSEKQIEKAISFLVKNINQTGNNPKPIILHSIKVGFNLMHENYSEKIIIVGILHDVIEDSEVTKEDIKAAFNDDIAEMVSFLSYDESIEEKKQKDEEMLSRLTHASKDVLIVKAADILENSDHWHKTDDQNQLDWIIEKTKRFLVIAKEKICNEKVYNDLLLKIQIEGY